MKTESIVCEMNLGYKMECKVTDRLTMTKSKPCIDRVAVTPLPEHVIVYEYLPYNTCGAIFPNIINRDMFISSCAQGTGKEWVVDEKRKVVLCREKYELASSQTFWSVESVSKEYPLRDILVTYDRSRNVSVMRSPEEKVFILQNKKNLCQREWMDLIKLHFPTEEGRGLVVCCGKMPSRIYNVSKFIFMAFVVDCIGNVHEGFMCDANIEKVDFSLWLIRDKQTLTPEQAKFNQNARNFDTRLRGFNHSITDIFDYLSYHIRFEYDHKSDSKDSEYEYTFTARKKRRVESNGLLD